MSKTMWHPDMPEEYKNAIITGDARELAKRIPDESIGLIFTDPPYNIGFARYENYSDNLPDDEYIGMLAGLRRMGPVAIIQYPEETCRYIVPALGTPTHVGAWCYSSNVSRRFRLISYYGISPRYDRILQPYKNPDDRRVIRNERPGTPIYEWWTDIQLVKGNSKEKNHICPIPLKLAKRIITLSTNAGDTVLDPFVGGGTIPAACKILGRNYIAFEIDPETAELARERVRNTQPPLFVMEPEQLELLDE